MQGIVKVEYIYGVFLDSNHGRCRTRCRKDVDCLCGIIDIRLAHQSRRFSRSLERLDLNAG